MELFATVAAALTAWRYVIWPLASLLVLAVVIIRWWDALEYFFVKVRTGFPLLGFIARNARQNQESDPDPDGGGLPWYRSERELCARYYRFYERADKDANFFDKCANYLNKVEERGRKPTGIVLWSASVFLVLLEAFIFALVLAPFIANNISANQAEFSAIVISLLIGTILVPATHLMGAEIHKNNLIKKARVWHAQARRDNEAKKLQADSRVDLEHTELDDAEPKYLHIINRVQHNANVSPTWWKSGIAVVLIAVLAIGAYLIRTSTINELETEQVNASPYAAMSAQAQGDSPFNATLSGPFTLPGEAVEDNREADQRAASEVISERIFAYKLTFIILSVIFVGVQIIGILIGLLRSYAGIQSKEAAGYIAGFSSKNEFALCHERKRDQVARDADMHLNRLQKAIAQHHDLGGSNERNQRRSFTLYMREQERSRLHRQPPAVQPPLPSRTLSTPVHTPQSVVTAQALSIPETGTPAPVMQTTGVDQAPPEAGNDSTATDGQIKELGDLSGYSAEELASIAQELGLDPGKLFSRQKVQRAVARARQGR